MSPDPHDRLTKAIFWYTVEVRKGTNLEQVERFMAMNVDKSVSDTFVSIADQLRAEGRTQGRAEGRKEGVVEGKRLLLAQLMTARFGALSPEISQRIQSAGHEELRWTLGAAPPHGVGSADSHRRVFG
ncbi:MAG: hypothetical protein AB1486_06935 [Planctomycetota bacterium]